MNRMDSAVLSLHLTVLEARGLVRVVGEGPDRIIRFKHALVREAGYDSILNAQRAQLHRRVADAIQSLYPERDLNLSLTLAGHYLNARAFLEFEEELLPRSRQIISSGRGQALIDLIQRVPAEWIQTGEFDMETMLGEAYQARGDYARARELFKEVLDNVQNKTTRSRVLYDLGVTLMRLSQPQQAIEYHRQSLTLAQEIGDELLQAWALRGIGIAYWVSADYEQAERFLAQSRELSARVGDTLGLAHCQLDLSSVYRDRGEYPRAIDVAQAALQLYRASGLVVLAANAEQVLGACYYSAGDLQSAAACYERATATSRELGDPIGEAVGIGNLAELYDDLGHLDRAGDYYTRASALAVRLHDDYILSFALTGLALVQLKQMQAQKDAAAGERARVNAEQALAAATRLNSKERIGAAHRMLAQIEVACGDRAQAQAQAKCAVEMLEQVGHALELKRAMEVYADALRPGDEMDIPQGG
ncbi:MAG: tetratricopeptide repeat protein [Anaerolineae bacterium]